MINDESWILIYWGFSYSLIESLLYHHVILQSFPGSLGINKNYSKVLLVNITWNFGPLTNILVLNQYLKYFLSWSN